MIGIIRPGDTLVIATSKVMSDADGVKYRQDLEKNLPGVKIIVSAAVTEMAIYREAAAGTERDEPATW